MVRKPVIWTTRAKTEKTIILKFWVYNNKSENYAVDLNIEFKDAAQLLETFHFLGKPTDYIDIRALIIKNFTLFYKIEINNIVIVAIWDNRRDDKKLNLDD